MLGVFVTTKMVLFNTTLPACEDVCASLLVSGAAWALIVQVRHPFGAKIICTRDIQDLVACPELKGLRHFVEGR